MYKKLLGVLTAVTLAIGLTGCEEPTKATGGGRIDPFAFYPSTGATFGFNGDNCDGSMQGHFNFVDNTVSPQVRLGADVTVADLCTFFGCGFCFEDEIVIEATYTSHNQSNPGTGTLTACLRDSGEGMSAIDGAFVAITSGPFDGYAVEGNVSGNVQLHGCD